MPDLHCLPGIIKRCAITTSAVAQQSDQEHLITCMLEALHAWGTVGTLQTAGHFRLHNLIHVPRHMK